MGHRNDQRGVLSSIAVERLEQGIKEYRAHPGSKIMVTGSHGAHFNTTVHSHAYYLEKYLRGKGIPADHILPFIPSQNTFEDGLFSRELLKKYGHPKIMVVTSDFHLKRARYIFTKVFPPYQLTFVTSVTKSSSEELRVLQEHEQNALRLLKTKKSLE